MRLTGPAVSLTIVFALCGLEAHAQNARGQMPVELSRELFPLDTLQQFRQAIAISPFEAANYRDTGDYLASKRVLSIAEIYLHAAALLDSSMTNRHSLVKSNVDRWQRAATSSRKTTGEPSNTNLLLAEAGSALLSGEVRDADKAVRRAATLNERQQLAAVDFFGDLVYESYQALDKLADILALQSARAQVQQGDARRALTSYERLADKYPAEPFLSPELSRAYAKAGDYSSALLWLSRSSIEPREYLLERQQLLLQSGKLTVAATELAEYYREHPDDGLRSQMVEDLHYKLGDFPGAQRPLEIVRPDLQSGGSNNAGFSPSAGPRRGLTARPWVRNVSIVGSGYRYAETAAGASVRTSIGPRFGMSFGAGSHSVTIRRNPGSPLLEQQRIRISIGIDIGTTTVSRQIEKRAVRFATAVGFSSSATGQLRPFIVSSVEHQSYNGVRLSLDLRSIDETESGLSTATGLIDGRMTAAQVRVASSETTFLRYTGNLLVSTLTATETTGTPAGTATDAAVRLGVNILPLTYASIGLRQARSDHDRDLYWEPRLYRRAEASVSWERPVDRGRFGIRGGIATTSHSTSPLPFIVSALQTNLSDKLSIDLAATIERDARGTNASISLDTESVLLTATQLSASIRWIF